MTSPARPPVLQSESRLTRDERVEAQLVRTFVRYAFPSLHLELLLVLAIAVILYGHVPATPLCVWSLSVGAITLLRYRAIASFGAHPTGLQASRLNAFVARCVLVWTLGGVLWGACVLFFFLDAPIYEQLFCMFMLVGLGGFAVGTFSPCAGCFKGFIHGMGAMVVVTLLSRFAVPASIADGPNFFATIALVSLYWALLLVAGRQLQAVYRAKLGLQFDNEELIASLTEKSRAAMEAVAIKNRFIASAAHDLRQPVHALELYAGWLAAEPEYVALIAPKIVRSTQAVADLFNSLFDLAGLESNPLQVHLQEVNLATLVKDLEVQYLPAAQARGLRLRTRSQRAIVQTDPVLLKRLVGNLLSNALKNTRQGGVLLALRRRRREGWCIDVWDTGVGIAPEHQQAIFQEFYRIPLQGTEEGFGLGLAIVSRLSKALGYPLGLASKVGKGSVFRVEVRSSLATEVAAAVGVDSRSAAAAGARVA